MPATKTLPILDLTRGKRCSDFDGDCAGVKNHLKCFTGGVRDLNGERLELPPADGYCPYVVGER